MNYSQQILNLAQQNNSCISKMSMGISLVSLHQQGTEMAVSCIGDHKPILIPSIGTLSRCQSQIIGKLLGLAKCLHLILE